MVIQLKTIISFLAFFFKTEIFNNFKTWNDAELYLISLENYSRDPSAMWEGQKKLQGKMKNNEERITDEIRSGRTHMTEPRYRDGHWVMPAGGRT